MNRKVLILVALAAPVLLHASYHAGTDPRSFLSVFSPLFQWAHPIFSDDTFLYAHVIVNAAEVLFVILAIIWVAKK